jgi:UDP-N-acetylglucosamine 2-epimerase (non-hydrolysing)
VKARDVARTKFLVVLGTRPEAIKLAPLIRELRLRPDASTCVCLTGQHRDMVAGILSFFEIDVDADLEVMQPNQSLSGLASRALAGLDKIIEDLSPDWTIVQGDTTTAFVAALASFHRRVKVAHIEAGLRSFDRSKPFPEEVNRVMTATVTDLHFCPTIRASENLLAERVPLERIRVVGNTVIDALHLAVTRMGAGELAARSLALSFPRFELDRPFILVTGHRRESFGKPFEDLCLAIRDVAELEDVQFVYPVHLNPNVRQPVFEILRGLRNVHLGEPVGYPELVWLAQHCRFVLTDSGGIQEEAAALGKPVLVMRDVTERRESVDAGVSRLVGTKRAVIREWTLRLLRDDETYRHMARKVLVYGDGRASERIADGLGLASRRSPVAAFGSAELTTARHDAVT